jgi:hypothetical protein
MMLLLAMDLVNIEKMKPDKQIVTLIKSIVRVIGFGLLAVNMPVGIAVLIGAECIALFKQLL